MAEVTQTTRRDKFISGDTSELEVWEITTTSVDGEVVASKKHVTVLAPGADVLTWPEDVQALARASWTPEAVQAWTQSIVDAHQAERDARQAVLDDLAAKTEAIERANTAFAAALAEHDRNRVALAALGDNIAALLAA